MSKRIVLLSVLAVVLVAGGLAGWHWWTVGRFIASTDNAYVQGDIAVVSPKIAGYVREVRVDDNQQVKAGDVLVVLEDRDFQARVAEAKAQVGAAEAAITAAEQRAGWQQSVIRQTQTAVPAAEADARRAKQDYARFNQLVDKDFVSRQRYESATADARRSAANLAQAQAAVAAQRDQLGIMAADKAQAEARLRQAQAALNQAQIDLDNTVIRAAIDGVVGNKGVRLGEYVRAGSNLMSVVPVSDVYVVANFKETQLSRMRPGQPVELKVDAFPDRRVTGRVESFAPASGAQFSLLPPENATGNFTKIVQRLPIKIVLDRNDPVVGLLRPGLSVEASVDTREPGNGPAMAALTSSAQAAER